MTRRLLNVSTVLSLLLCVAVLALWVRSHRTADLMHLRTHDRFFYVSTYRGRLKAGTWLRRDHDPASLASGYHPYPAVNSDPTWKTLQRVAHPHRLGFHYWPGHSGRIWSATQLAVPAAFPLGLTAAAPAAWLTNRILRGKRWRTGLCPRCGYDLRATPERCPECGRLAAATTSSASAPETSTPSAPPA